MHTKRFLVTTSDERSWKPDQPTLFLGEWCRCYDRKHIWSGMDAVVAAPYGLRPGQKVQDVSYVQSLSNNLLLELAEALNEFHKTHHDARYWNIVLGHWLQRYVAVIFNRYFTLEQALDMQEVSSTIVFDASFYSLATNDSMTFIWACNDDVWNHVLYSKILDYWGCTQREIYAEPLQGQRGFFMEGDSRFTWKRGAKKLALKAANKAMQKLSGNEDAFIVNSFLTLEKEIKLQLSLGQCPQLWRSPALKKVEHDPERRLRFGIDAEKYSGFERFVRLQLSDVIPTCFLEGYAELTRMIESLHWPHNPKFIFTSNNFDTDEIFKVWAGSKAEAGTPYFVGQHGNNYGTHVYLGNQHWPERVTSDKFITWGWTDGGGSNNAPAFVFSTVGRKQRQRAISGGVLLVELHPPQLIVPWDDYFEFGVYQEEQFRFVLALPEDIKQKLTVRLHHAYKNFRWSDEQRWKDRSPFTKIETGSVPLKQLIAQSRLVVHSYNSSGILENLALNIPTMCFWHGGLDHLLPSAKPYYELLRGANILADTPEQAAEFIALHWNNIGEWWESPKVQDARRTFCDQYARTEKRPIRALKRLLTTYANQGSSK